VGVAFGMGGTTSAEVDAVIDESLFFAALHGDTDELKRCIEEAGNVNHRQKDQGYVTPLIVAAQDGALECLTLLCEARTIDFNIGDEYGCRI
jgi:hypothetical protein